VSDAWVVALPMYDFPELAETHDRLWAILRAHLLSAGVSDLPPRLTRQMHLAQIWRHPRLLLAQACEYPLAKHFAADVRLVATPRYGAPGCVAARYRSAIVVRNNDPADTLTGLRGRRCVINETHSNSGMNLLRAAVATQAAGKSFFETVLVSGSHRRSVRMVVAGEADVAAIDCVTLAHLSQLDPRDVAALKILSWTHSTPCLPLITASGTSDVLLGQLRTALTALATDIKGTALAARLFLLGFDTCPRACFREVLELERSAAQQGYPALS
jgi:ABC-type phosphate/phosphonate transport system substrate-binding protein